MSKYLFDDCEDCSAFETCGGNPIEEVLDDLPYDLDIDQLDSMFTDDAIKDTVKSGMMNWIVETANRATSKIDEDVARELDATVQLAMTATDGFIDHAIRVKDEEHLALIKDYREYLDEVMRAYLVLGIGLGSKIIEPMDTSDVSAFIIADVIKEIFSDGGEED